MPGVKGTFEVENRASGPLRDMRTDARMTKEAFRDLGVTLDRVGANTTNLDRYKRSLSDMRDSGVRSLNSLGDQWDRTAARTDRSVEAMKGGLDDLQIKMKEVSDTRMTPDIDVRGIDESLAKVALLKAQLRELDHERASPRVTTSGGGVGSGGGGIGSSYSGALSSASSDTAALTMGVPKLAIVAGAALPVIQSLTGATTALVSSMTGAALGAGAVSLAGGGALAVGLSSIMAVAKPVLSQIEAVWKAETSLTQAREQAVMPGQQQVQQLHAVIQAEDQLQAAQLQSRQAQIALTEARRQARNELTNLSLAASGAALNEKQAALTLASSQQALYAARTSPTSSPLQVEQAELSVQQAQLGVRQSHQQDREAMESLRLGRARGVQNAPQVVSARTAEQQSVLAVRNAQWAVQEARRNQSGGSTVESARLAYQSALNKAPAGTRELLMAGRAFVHEWKGATKEASHDFIGILSGTLGTLHAMMPTLAGASNRDMRALRSSGADFGHFLSGSQNERFITTGSEMFAENLHNAEQSVEHIFVTAEHIIEAARPFLKEATTDFDHWTESWATGTANITKTRSEIGKMVEDARAWTHMWMTGWKLLHDIAVVGGASGQGNSMLRTFTRAMDRWDVWVKDNPQKVQAFFRQTREGAEGLAKAVGQIAHNLNSLATQLQPLMKGGLGILSLLNSTGLGSSVGGLGGLYGFYRGGRGVLGGGGRSALGGGGRVVASPGAGAAAGLGSGLFMLGGRGSGEMVGNVRTMPNVATALPGGGFIVSSASGRAVSRDAQIIAEREAAAAGSPFLSIAESSAGRFGLRGALGAGASKLGKLGTAGARMAAPYLALNDVLSIAGGQNPFKGSSPTSGVLGGAAQGALLGAGIGSAVPVVGTAAGAIVGGGAGLIAGVASNAASLHRDIFGPSSAEKAVEAYERMAKQIQAVGGRLDELDPQQLQKLNSEAVKLEKNGSPALKGVRLEITRIAGATGKAAQASSEWSHKYNGAVQAMASASHRSLGEVKAVATTTAKGIEQELGSGSAKAREALARNFTSAAAIVEQRMRETGQFTKEGVAIINQELDQALAEYGIKAPKGVTTQAKGTVLKFRMSGDSTAGFGSGGQAQDLTPSALAKQEGRATGGRLPGSGSYDTVKMSDGGYGAPGELVVPWHVEAAANMGLSRAGMPSLGQMISRNTIPHSTPAFRATGGMVGTHYDRLVAAANRVSSANFPYKWGGGHEQPSHFEPFDCSGAVSYATQQAGYNVPTTTAQNIAGWGFPAGEGAATIFYKGEPGAHTFMRIGGKYWGTSGFARPGGGAGWFDQAPDAAYLGGFNKVHLPNLGSDSVAIGGAGATFSGISLKAPKISGVGLPGTFADAGMRGYAKALSAKANRMIGSTPGALTKGGGAGGGNPLRDSVLAAAGGKEVGASFYGGPSDPSSGVTGYRGDNLLQHPDSYAELNMGHALGGLPYLTPLRVSYGGKSVTLKKRDIGAGGGPVNGHARAIDLWYEAANALGFNGLGVVDVKRMATGGRLGGIPYVGAYKDGGSFTTRPGQPVAFVAGEGSNVEDVHIAPRRGAQRFASHATPTVKVDISIGDVKVADVGELKDVISEASDEAARKLLAALGRRRDRKVAGTVQD